MIRHLLAGLLALGLLAGCAGDAAQKNRDRLGAAEAGYIVAQNGAILYLGLTPCARNPTPPCRDFNTALKVQEVDRKGTAILARIHARVKLNPADEEIPSLLKTLSDVTAELTAATPKQ